MKNKSPWVKCTDRLPVEADAPSGQVLVHYPENRYDKESYISWGVHGTVFTQSGTFDYWMAIPLLPEADNLEAKWIT